MFELGMRASLERDLLEVSTPFLEELRAAVNETVHLGVRDGTEVVYVAKLVGHRKVDVPSSTGGRLGLYCTAVGKALLAHAPADVQHDVLRDPLVRRTPRTITAPGVLAHQLVQVRSEGVAFEYEESRVGVVCVAAPVFGPGGAPDGGGERRRSCDAIPPGAPRRQGPRHRPRDFRGPRPTDQRRQRVPLR